MARPTPHARSAARPTRQAWRRAGLALLVVVVAAAAGVAGAAPQPPPPPPPPPVAAAVQPSRPPTADRLAAPAPASAGRPPPAPSPPTTTPVVLAPALLAGGRLVVPAGADPPRPPFNVSLCGGLDVAAVSSQLPRDACLVEVVAVREADFAAAAAGVAHVPGPALAAGLFNWPHYGHALGNALFGVWGTLVEQGLVAGGGGSAGRGDGERGLVCGRGRGRGRDLTPTPTSRRPPLPIYVRACGQGQDVLEAATAPDGRVDVAACTPLAPAFHALAGPGRRVEFRSWTDAVAGPALLFHHLVAGVSLSADQYNHTLDGGLLRALAARVAEEVGVADGGGGGGGGGRLGSLLARRHRHRGRPPPTVLVIHRTGSRAIENEGALVDALDAWARARGGRARAVAFEAMAFADVVEAVRSPAWTALVGVDGTGLLNAVWARCGVGVRLATWGARALVPTKGLNFDRVARATAGRAAVWECADRGCAVLEGAAERLLAGGRVMGNGSASQADAFMFVTRQGVRVEVGEVVGLVREAWEQGGSCGGGV